MTMTAHSAEILGPHWHSQFVNSVWTWGKIPLGIPTFLPMECVHSNKQTSSKYFLISPLSSKDMHMPGTIDIHIFWVSLAFLVLFPFGAIGLVIGTCIVTFFASHWTIFQHPAWIYLAFTIFRPCGTVSKSMQIVFKVPISSCKSIHFLEIVHFCMNQTISTNMKINSNLILILVKRETDTGLEAIRYCMLLLIESILIWNLVNRCRNLV